MIEIKYLSILKENCRLFNDISLDDLCSLFEDSRVLLHTYNKGDYIANEGDQCNSLGILVDGTLKIQKFSSSGKAVTILHLSIGNTFGEAVLYSDCSCYPATISAEKDSTVAYIQKDDFTSMISKNNMIFRNFAGLLSNKILLLNKKISYFTSETIRSKVARYILDLYEEQKSFYIELSADQKEIANLMGVERPSLSRELAKMREDGLIEHHRGTIKIVDIDGIRNSIV